MNKFEPNGELLRYILSGKACLWIGAGASAEMGYPDWRSQVEAMKDRIVKEGIAFDREGYDNALSQNDYTLALDVLSRANGLKRETFIGMLRDCTKPVREGTDSIYNMVTRWPFRFYATTNFDDEIIRHLEKNGRENFSVHYNDPEDLAILGGSACDAVFKVHGDLAGHGTPVVTSADYAEFRGRSTRAYYREAVQRLLSECMLVVIGYSLKDPDIQYLLETQKEEIRPERPIFAFLVNATPAEVERLKELYNVVVVPYVDTDGTHRELNRILATYDQFIGTETIGQLASSDAEKAIPLFMLRRLNRGGKRYDAENYVLMKLPSSGETPMDQSRLLHENKLQSFDWQGVLSQLATKGLANGDGGFWRRTAEGDRQIEDAVNRFRGSKKSAFQQFVKTFGAALSSSEEESYSALAENCIEQIFSARGLGIAAGLFNEDYRPDGDEMMTIFSKVAEASRAISNVDHKLLFLQAIRRFLLQPMPCQKFYLAALAQGYFIYHMMGKDPGSVTAVKELLQQDCWFVDSNIIQPLCATGCEGNDFYVNLFTRLRQAKVQLYTTHRVLKEVEEHFLWVDHSRPDKKSYRSILMTSRDAWGYNFFQDGFVRSIIGRSVTSFDEYKTQIMGRCGEGFADVCARFGINVVDADLSSPSAKRKFNELCHEIQTIRINQGRFRDNQLQVPTEAELSILMGEMEDRDSAISASRKVFFLSTSLIFFRTMRRFKRWSATGLSRYVHLLPNEDDEMESLIDCMRNEFYGIGLKVITDENFDKYFGGDIRMAKLKYDDEKACLRVQMHDGADARIAELDEVFERTPAYEIPQFVEHFNMMLEAQSVKDAKRNKEIAEQAMAEAAKWKGEYEKLKEDIRLESDQKTKESRRRMAEKAAAINRKKKARKTKRKHWGDKRSRRK